MRAQAPMLFAQTGRRFRTVGWIALATLAATGLVQVVHRAGGTAALADGEWWRTPFGRILGLKLALVAIALVLSGVHDFWLGPRASQVLRAEPGSPRALRWRTAASWFGRANLLLGLVIFGAGPLALDALLARRWPEVRRVVQST